MKSRSDQRPTSHRRRGRQGLSLLEVLLSLAIFSVAIVGIIQALATQIRAEKMAEDLTRATMLAQNVLEEIRYARAFEEDSQEGEFEDGNVGFTWAYQVQQSEIEGLHRVQVTVSWSSGALERDYTIETLLAER